MKFAKPLNFEPVGGRRWHAKGVFQTYWADDNGLWDTGGDACGPVPAQTEKCQQQEEEDVRSLLCDAALDMARVADQRVHVCTHVSKGILARDPFAFSNETAAYAWASDMFESLGCTKRQEESHEQHFTRVQNLMNDVLHCEEGRWKAAAEELGFNPHDEDINIHSVEVHDAF